MIQDLKMAAYQVPKDESRDNHIYNKAIKKPVDEKAFLLEAGQGKNVNGNVFALLRYIRGCRAFDDFRVMLSLVPEKRADAEAKLQKYGIGNVEFIDFGGHDYRRALGTAKYLITDNSFPAYFYKRSEQVYLNTWHGTPLKALGRTDIDNAISIANVQANMAKADWLLHPNRYTKQIMMKDYMMERVFMHKTVVMDYPRNDALYREEFRGEITERFGLAGKKVFAYMPTWRGVGRDADVDSQLARTKEALAAMEKLLRDDEVLFVNLHFLIDKGIDYSEYSKVFAFPPEYETYDFLAVCDTLITDYSSVSIDFAGTGKDVVLYLYDYEDYKRDKGFYLDVKKLPFKQAETLDELEAALHSERRAYDLDDLLKSDGGAPAVLSEPLTCADHGNSAERLIKLITGEAGDDNPAAADQRSGGSQAAGLDDPSACSAAYEIEDYGARDYAPHIVYFDNINRDDVRGILDRIQRMPASVAESADAESERPVIMFATSMTPETIETLKTFDKSTDFVRISGHLYCSNNEFWLLRKIRKYGIFKEKARAIYDRESRRQIRQFKAASFEVKQCRNIERINMLAQVPTGKSENK